MLPRYSLTSVLSGFQFSVPYNLLPYLVEIEELLTWQMEEFSPLVWVGVASAICGWFRGRCRLVEQLENKGPPGDDSRSARQKVPSDDVL